MKVVKIIFVFVTFLKGVNWNYFLSGLFVFQQNQYGGKIFNMRFQSIEPLYFQVLAECVFYNFYSKNL